MDNEYKNKITLEDIGSHNSFENTYVGNVDKEYEHKMEWSDFTLHDFGCSNCKNYNKEYHGHEIIRMLENGELKEGNKLKDSINKDITYEVKYDGDTYYIGSNIAHEETISMFCSGLLFKFI